MPYTVKVLSFCRVISWYCGMVRSSSDQIYQVICQCRLYNTSSELSNSSYHIICSKKTYNLWWLGNGILVEISKCKFKHTPLLCLCIWPYYDLTLILISKWIRIEWFRVTSYSLIRMLGYCTNQKPFQSHSLCNRTVVQGAVLWVREEGLEMRLL